MKNTISIMSLFIAKYNHLFSLLTVSIMRLSLLCNHTIHDIDYKRYHLNSLQKHILKPHQNFIWKTKIDIIMYFIVFHKKNAFIVKCNTTTKIDARKCVENTFQWQYTSVLYYFLVFVFCVFVIFMGIVDFRMDYYKSF